MVTTKKKAHYYYNNLPIINAIAIIISYEYNKTNFQNIIFTSQCLENNSSIY